MGATSRYALPYQGLSDAPNGPTLGQNLAQAVETALGTVDDRVTTAENDINDLQALQFYRQRRTVTGSVAGTVQFNSIPATLRNIQIRWKARSDAATTLIDLRMLINGDASAHYHWEFVQGNVAGTVLSNFGNAQTFARLGYMPADSAVTNSFGTGRVDIPSWDNPGATGWLGWVSQAQATVTLGTTHLVDQDGGSFTGTGPYTSITLLPASGAFKIGSDFCLLGEAA